MGRAACVLAGSAALALGACGSEATGAFTAADSRNAPYTIDPDSGETSMTITGKDGDATMRSGAKVPVSLPDGFTLFPGSRVVTNTVVERPGGRGTLITFEADAPAGKVLSHYRDAARAAGFDIRIEMNTNGTLMVGGERKGEGSSFSVTATDGSPTSGQIIIGITKAG